MNALKTWRVVAACALLLAVRPDGRVAAQAPLGGPELFVGAPAADGSAFLAIALRQRFVTLRLALFDTTGAREPLNRRDGRLLLNLFPDAMFTAVLDRVEFESGDAFVWVGHLEGGVEGTATLAVRDGVMAGEVRTATALYEIRFVDGQTHVVRQVDPATFPPELEPLRAPPGPAAAADRPAPPPTAAADDGSLIDVLVVYTPAARDAAGGTASMGALIDLAVANANTSYTNSGVIQRMRLVHKKEIAYTEAGSTGNDFNTDLDRLTNTSDGFVDEVHAMRNTYGADLVELVINNSSSCGLAWLMSANSPLFHPYGFSVAHHGCIAGNLTLAHEMGHNQGLEHDNVPSPPGPFPFSYARGYNEASLVSPPVFPVRDIMAVSSPQPRQQNFSNPAANWVSVARPSGTADRNGALALDNARVAVANFRPTATPVTSDHDGDRSSDILWRQSTGGAAIWLMNGTAVTGGGGFTTVDPSWQIAGTGDYNGDGKADILWRQNTGSAAIWLMNGTAVIGGGGFTTVDPSWQIVGTGDYNGDGKADILWRQNTGGAAIWFMNGTTAVGGGGFTAVDPSWQIVGSGDYDGDRRADILWRQNTGAVAMWLMNGTAVIGGGGLAVVDLSYQIAGSGDYNGDGRADILWRQNTGAVTIWFMNGTLVYGGGGVGTVDPSWQIVGTGDHSGDGRADILWRQNTGAAAIWFMNGTATIGGGGFTTVDPSWQIVGTGQPPPIP